jgi:succinate-semialdehyde dehydrogenase/glutarate-semialdehyde dehydrogenase/succinyl-CoA reductase
MEIKVINPATEEVIKELPVAGREEVRKATERARRAQASWALLKPEERGEHLRAVGRVLRERKEEYGRTMALEMGKALREAVAEVEKCAWCAEFFADQGPRWLQEEQARTEALKSYVRFDPLGVVGSIMPWNFPMWQIVRFGIPALIAGNVHIVKPSSYSPLTALNLAEAFGDGGAPPDIFQVVVGDRTTANHLIHGDTDLISVTGSVETGAKVMEECAREVKKCILELGGSDPFIVAGDADLEQAAQGAVTGRFINCGQSCIAAKRFIVVQSVAGEFSRLLAERAEGVKWGDPLDPATEMGPMVRGEPRRELHQLLQDDVAGGARLITGGEVPKGKGYYYPPTVLGDVKEGMRVLREETFGPAAPITVVGDLDEAVALANASEFGLGASIWTRDLAQAEALAARIQAGMVFVNNPVKSDPRLPFGGVKKSGVGRELGRYGLLEMVNIKTVVVQPPAHPTGRPGARSE